MSIETTYAGHLFRSRLEARWAAYFDLLGWTWDYEPFDADGYIPDFLIHGDRPLLVEIKPVCTWHDYVNVAMSLEPKLVGHWQGDVAVFGASPLPNFGSHPFVNLTGTPSCLLCESDMAPGGWDSGEWIRCGKCSRVAVIHSTCSYAGRPCGHHDGDHYINLIDRSYLHNLWGKAHEWTRWERAS